jgi:predicted GIY-YIG superfamily endonuclease
METKNLPTGPGVYLLRCTHNGLAYVGSSENVRRRVRHHLARLEKRSHRCRMLLSAYLAAGPKRFEAVLIHACEEAELSQLEQAEWERLKAAGLLLSDGDYFIPRGDYPETSSAKAEAMRARWADPEKRAALAEKVNAARADPSYREECKGRNSLAGSVRWKRPATEATATGAYFNKKDRKWVAQIRVDGKRKYLGRFDTEQEARAVYLDEWERRRIKV